MKHTRMIVSTLAAALTLLSASAFAQNKPEGFTCCNIRYESGGTWISDINYVHPNLIPLGSPAKVTDYGRYRAAVTINGTALRLGNDYSRDLSNEAFAARWIVAEDPKKKLATFPKATQDAIKEMKVRKGMTREQVIMSLGPPVTSENPDAKGNVLRYWLSSFDEFQVLFDGDRVKEISGHAMTLNRVEAK
jgi:hypothetical protein